MTRSIFDLHPEGAWIIVTTMLPIETPPPLLSIHWSAPWPNKAYAKAQRKKLKTEADIFGDGEPFGTEDDDWFYDAFNRKEPNWIKARKVRYLAQEIRLFPHEFNVVENVNLREYVIGRDGFDPTHVLEPDSVPGERLLNLVLEGGMSTLLDAAQVEGASFEHALYLALGGEMEDLDDLIDFPPLGWYRCHEGMAQYFGENVLFDRAEV